MYCILSFSSLFEFPGGTLRNQNDKASTDCNLSGPEIVSFSHPAQVSMGQPEKTAGFSKQCDYFELLMSAFLLCSCSSFM